MPQAIEALRSREGTRSDAWQRAEYQLGFLNVEIGKDTLRRLESDGWVVNLKGQAGKFTTAVVFTDQFELENQHQGPWMARRITVSPDKNNSPVKAKVDALSRRADGSLNSPDSYRLVSAARITNIAIEELPGRMALVLTTLWGDRIEIPYDSRS